MAAEPHTSDELSQSKGGKISVSNVSKTFDTKNGSETVFEDISFEIEPGSFTTLIGKSGSGKSTLLDIVSGILEPTSGRVEFETPQNQGDATLGYVFQSPRLLPWETCLKNIEFVHGDNPEYSQDDGKKYLDMVDLSNHYDKYPTQLSGGQKQRVGIARAFSIDPDLLLMDEPFSALDEITAEALRSKLMELWKMFDKTVFFVTHDITEAIELSDRILMIGDGRIYDDMTVDLERPRDVDSEEFLRFRQEAIDRFHAID